VARWGWGEQIATTTYRGACLGRRHPDGFIWAGYQRMRERRERSRSHRMHEDSLDPRTTGMSGTSRGVGVANSSKQRVRVRVERTMTALACARASPTLETTSLHLWSLPLSFPTPAGIERIGGERRAGQTVEKVVRRLGA
jgi:hypothetical protein